MAHPDLDELLNALVPFAQKMLQERGEFYPFGASMQSDGTISLVSANADGSEFPKSTDLIELMEMCLQKEAKSGKIKASGICMDVRVIEPGKSDKTDAIRVDLEHKEGQVVSVFLPYEKGPAQKVTYGKIFASSAKQKIFVPVI
ncbi:MAG TPA: hypothetical protein VKT33_08985 [Candidatus Angelobacter sp.]|nr:hypothetical protein [Candidatus Angelobacter sp.]